MKFSFDAESYRKDLADQIKEKRSVDKDVAKELLENERETLRYRVAEDIKKVLLNIENQKNVRGESDVSLEQEKNVAQGEEISCETIKFEGSDGTEHELEILVTDIRDKIPEELNLVFDITRLVAIDARSSGIGTGTHKDIYGDFNGNENERKVLPQKHSSLDSHLFSQDLDLLDKLLVIEKEREGFIDHMLHLEYFPDANDERNFILEDPLKNSYTAPILNKYLDDAEKERLSMIIKYDRSIERYPNYLKSLDEFTEGAFTNPEMLNHFVAGDLPESTIRENPELMARFPHAVGSIIPNGRQYKYDNSNRSGAKVQEIPFDVKRQTFTHLWALAGANTTYSNENLLVVLCDPKKERFRKEVQMVHAYDDYDGRKLQERIKNFKDKGVLSQDADMIEGATKDAFVNRNGGVNFVFKKEEPWVYLADWIVDLYHGRLYKITEKAPSEE
jgi:hypothetical protein